MPPKKLKTSPTRYANKSTEFASDNEEIIDDSSSSSDYDHKQEFEESKDRSRHFPQRRISIHRNVSDNAKDKSKTSNSINEKNTSKQPLTLLVVLSSIILSIIVVKIYNSYDNSDSNNERGPVSIESIKEKFPEQDGTFWKAIISGINYTVHFESPSSYIFLFESEAEETTKKLLHEVSKYAVCELTKCGYSPIDFKEVLATANFSNVNDYGSILTSLKGKLENHGLMVIENLDEVPEKYAQAFHNLCDEISPLVKKSAFFFTMKVDKFERSRLFDVRYAEDVLKKKWGNIEQDIFGPIFTRISSMPLRVYPRNRDV